MRSGVVTVRLVTGGGVGGGGCGVVTARLVTGEGRVVGYGVMTVRLVTENDLWC